MIPRIFVFFRSIHFILGAFAGFAATMLAFTFVLTLYYTPNILLDEVGYYKDGKYYVVIEKSQFREMRRKCE